MGHPHFEPWPLITIAKDDMHALISLDPAAATNEPRKRNRTKERIIDETSHTMSAHASGVLATGPGITRQVACKRQKGFQADAERNTSHHGTGLPE